MTNHLHNNGHAPQSKNKRDRRGRRYQLPIAARAVLAAKMVSEHGWSQRQAAGLMCVPPCYVALVGRLNESDHWKLIRGELRLAPLWRDYRRGLAERRAQRLVAERKAEVKAAREEQDRMIDTVLQTVAFDRVVDRAVTQFGPEPLLEELDVALQRSGRDLGQVLTRVIEPDRIMRVLDQLTTPQLVAAE